MLDNYAQNKKTEDGNLDRNELCTLKMEPLTKIIELNTDSCFCDMLCDDVIHGLLANGYVLNITPCRYNDGKYTVMIEIGEIDDSFISQPTEESNE